MGIIRFGLRRFSANIQDVAKRLQSPTWKSVTVGTTTCQFRVGSESEEVAVGHIDKERTVIQELLMIVQETDSNVLDVGGNIGQFACFLGKCTEVISIEPYFPSFRTLKANFNRNSCHGEVVNAAVSTEKQVTLSVPWIPQPGWQTPSVNGFGKSVTIDGVKGKDLIAENDIGVVKIDVEGAELDVLRSCGDLQGVHTVVVEVHDPHWRRGTTEVDGVIQYLHKRDFTVSELENRGLESVLIAKR